MDTRDTAIELLIRLADGDPGRIAALHAECVDWQLDWPTPGPGGTSSGGRAGIVGRAAVADHYRAITAQQPAGRVIVRVEQIVVDGSCAVVTGSLVSAVNRTARSSRAFVLHLTVRDGLVTRHHLHEVARSDARAWSW